MKKVNFLDILISSVFSILCTTKIYSYLYNKIDITNLADFYISYAIYRNHNKYLDIFIYFIYLILVFLFLPLVCHIRRKIKLQKFKIQEFKIFDFKKIKSFFIKYQFIGLFGYILLHPFDGQFYPFIFIIILILIAISTLDAIKRQKASNPSISPFCLAPFVFILFFIPYNEIYAPLDFHHLGEKYATYFLTDKYNLSVYKDIMLVHGFLDILPSFLGKTLFGHFNVYGFYLGGTFVLNITILTFLTAFFYIFSKAPYLILFMLIFPFSTVCLYFIIFILLLEKEFLKKYRLWIFCYLLFSILISAYHTTMGTFWVISSLPLAIFVLIRAIKKKTEGKILYFTLLAFFIFLIIYFLKDLISNYIIQANEYIKGNLFAFGNNYGKSDNELDFIIKTFSFLAVPFFISELLKYKNSENKNICYFFFLIFGVIFPFISISYALGRIDSYLLTRIREISYAYLIVFVPYFLYKKCKIQNNNNAKTIFAILLIFFSINYFIKNTANNILHIKRANVEENQEIKYLGKMKFDPKIEAKFIKRYKFIKKYLKENDTFLDLTNQGMNYLYLDKKILIPFVSYFNSITTKQAKNSVLKLQKNPPDVILIKGGENVFEDIYPSIRINPLYRWILVNKMYSIKNDGENIILIKNKNAKNLTNKELYTLDKVFSNSELNFLCESWANSIKSLPIREKYFDFNQKINSKTVTIKFKTNINGKNLQLLYFEPVFSKETYNKKYIVEINGTKSILYCSSKSGKILIPFDNFPSWLMNENISEIKIHTKNKGNIFNSAIVKFYEKTN